MKIACFAQNIYNFLLDLSINPAAPFVSRTKARPSEKLRACYVRNLQDQKNSFKTSIKAQGVTKLLLNSFVLSKRILCLSGDPSLTRIYVITDNQKNTKATKMARKFKCFSKENRKNSKKRSCASKENICRN